jgi:signal transduction histidine kinase
MEKDAVLFPPRWRGSLIVRVIMLGAILLLCLLCSVVVIMNHFFNQAIDEMVAQAEEITESIYATLEDNPDTDAETLETEIKSMWEDLEIVIDMDADSLPVSRFHTERPEIGGLTHVGQIPLTFEGRQMIMTLRRTTAAQVEILRAFRNPLLMALTAIFVVSLGLMIYVIAKTLRPLRELSATCADISAGTLRNVSTRGASGEILALEQSFNTMVKSLHDKELMETKLRQAQRLSALGNLAAGIAHDVRNPLNAIKLLSSHAIDTLDDNKQHMAVRKPLTTIRDEVDRLEEIVSNFLSLAKESELTLEPQRIDTLLEECTRLFLKDAEERGIQLISELRAGDTMLMLDPKQWIRAILNVLLNALEACPQGGRVRLFSRLTDRNCEIEIRDDGPGLSIEKIQNVFDPYFTTKPGGTGLGLSITRGIIQEHGGTIELSSSEGQGCQVLISLPLEKTKVP